MHASPLHYFPLTAPFVLVLLLLVGGIAALLQLHVLAFAYERIGVARQYVFGVLLLSLFGSYVNIPVAELQDERMVEERVVTFFGVDWVVPAVAPRTIVAINLGGAIVPTALSIWLMVRNRLFASALAGVAIVTVVVHLLAYPVPGIGIATPAFAPPLTAAVVGMFLSRRAAPALAYISGALGTLIGADLLNLDKIQGLGAPIASIGGAGTFDGIFLTGILAVLLTGLRRPAPAPAPVDP